MHVTARREDGMRSAHDYDRMRLICLRCLILFGAAAGLFVAASAPSLTAAENSQLAQLWQEPRDLPSRDLFNGPWGAQNAPDPAVTYTFVKAKEKGVNPGVIVRDPQGRTW